MGVIENKNLRYLEIQNEITKLELEKQELYMYFYKNIKQYIKSLYPQIKYIPTESISIIEIDKKHILFDIYCSTKSLWQIHPYLKVFKMPIKYFDPKELKRLKMERKLELL